MNTSVTAAPKFFDPERLRWRYLAILFAVSTLEYFDRSIIAVVIEPIKEEFSASDTALGLLSGFGFALAYALVGLPVARLGDRGNRPAIIAVALCGWSTMTLACGFALNFTQLALARIGVGAAESCAPPSSQSLIADYFKPSERATAISIYNAAGNLGYLLGIGLGGYVAAVYGWRSAFLVAGAPGLIMALVTWFMLAEPRRYRASDEPYQGESFWHAVSILAGQASFVWALGGIFAFYFFAIGSSTFLPSFMIRSLHASLAEVSLLWGGTMAAATVIGALAGGPLADRLGRRDVRWLAWLPALLSGSAAPLYWLTLTTSNLYHFIAIEFFAEVLLGAALPAAYALVHGVCGAERRATAFAIVMIVSTLLGAGLGPLVTGMLSDFLHAAHGTEGLRYALMGSASMLLLGAGTFLLSACSVRADWVSEGDKGALGAS